MGHGQQSLHVLARFARHRYNPLDFVRRDERMATDCLVVASFVIPERADDTWAGAGRLLLSSLIGYVLASPLTKGAEHMRTVARMTTTARISRRF